MLLLRGESGMREWPFPTAYTYTYSTGRGEKKRAEGRVLRRRSVGGRKRASASVRPPSVGGGNLFSPSPPQGFDLYIRPPSLPRSERRRRLSSSSFSLPLFTIALRRDEAPTPTPRSHSLAREKKKVEKAFTGCRGAARTRPATHSSLRSLSLSSSVFFRIVATTQGARKFSPYLTWNKIEENIKYLNLKAGWIYFGTASGKGEGFRSSGQSSQFFFCKYVRRWGLQSKSS